MRSLAPPPSARPWRWLLIAACAVLTLAAIHLPPFRQYPFALLAAFVIGVVLFGEPVDGIVATVLTAGAALVLLPHGWEETAVFTLAALMLTTERARRQCAERQTRAVRARADAIVRTAFDAIITIDAQGCVVLANPAAERLFGYTQAELAGRDLADLLIPPELRAAHRAALAAAVRAGTVRRPAPLATTALRRDGTTFPVEIAFSHVVVEGALYFTAYLRDISERQRQEEERTRLLAQAEDALRVRDDFLTAASHDLRTPLTTIMGRAEVVQRRVARGASVPPEWLAAQIAALVRAGHRMARTVEDITDAAQLQMGQALALHQEDLDLGAFAAEVVAFVTGTMGPWRHVSIVLERPADALWVAGDRARLERVLYNLLDNAIKYSPAGSPVRVTVQADDGWVRLAVSDEGVGIPAADLPHLFTRFYRASNAVSYSGGTGIGLAAVKRIVEQHGGHISIASRLGEGTTVTVWLHRTESLSLDKSGDALGDAPGERTARSG